MRKRPAISGWEIRGGERFDRYGVDDTNPAIVGMGTALENLGKKATVTRQGVSM